MVKYETRDTRGRRRAKHAYDELRGLKNRAKVCTRVQGFPMEVRSQGLAVAIATLLKEDRGESRALASLIASWVLGDADIITDADKPREPSRAQLLERVSTCSRTQYLALQAETLAYLEHLKRLASALEAEPS